MMLIQRETLIRYDLPEIAEKVPFIGQIMIEENQFSVSSESEIFRDPREYLYSFVVVPAEYHAAVNVKLEKVRKSNRRILFCSNIIQLSRLNGSCFYIEAAGIIIILALVPSVSSSGYQRYISGIKI